MDWEVFAGDDFDEKIYVPKETIISFLNKNISATVIVCDENNKPIAYFQVFPLKRDFEEKYIKGAVDLYDITADDILDENAKDINLYLCAIAILKEYRGVKVVNAANPGVEVSVVKLLLEGFVDCLIDLVNIGVKIHNFYGEGVTDKGKALCKSFCGENSLIHQDEKTGYAFYGGPFNPRCDALLKCRNRNKLIELIK